MQTCYYMSLAIDLGFVLEVRQPEELHEAFLRAFSLNRLDCAQAERLGTMQELPLLRWRLQQRQLAQMPDAVFAVAVDAGCSVPLAAVSDEAGAGGIEAAAGQTGLVVRKEDQQQMRSAYVSMPDGVSVTVPMASRLTQQHQQPR